MTISNIVVFITGILFFTLGWYYSRFYKWRKAKGYIPLTVGLCLVYLPTIGPLSRATQKIDEIVQVNTNNVMSIVIKPANASYPNLVNKDKTITDRQIINQLCVGLHKINVHDEGLLKNPEAVGLLQINETNNRILIFEVRKAGQRTALSLDSKGISGWHYADLEAYDFGQVLNSILK